ncbi:exo-alpha-sialidase [Pseudoalteromonas sp. A25]|uniref:exo-alpha-sialidase n=1 Tax=Pseudoalteromonas sp. A25 TaxID=116092 RepID=UPI001E4094B2|nr:exo-alpha-sialidase [Pseudoalteromonas sp. A25]
MLKKGHSPYDWQGYVVISRDFTRWSKPCRLPGNLIGPTKHAPLWLNSDWLLLPSSTEKGPSRITIEKLNVNTGETQLVNVNHTAAKITEHFLQPALIKYPNNEIHGYCRSNLANLYHFKSTDNGNSFSSLYRTDIPNPNSAFALLRAINTEGYYMAINPSHQNRKKLWVIFINWAGEKRIIHEEPNTDNDDLAYPALAMLNDGSLLLCYSVNQQTLRFSTIHL